MKKNDLEAAFRNITKIAPEPAEETLDEGFSPFPTENEASDASPEEIEEALLSESDRDEGPYVPEEQAENKARNEDGFVLLRRKEQKELRNIRKQFVITETLNNKLKEKSRELNLSENEVICQLLEIM